MHSDEPESASNSEQSEASTFDYNAWTHDVEALRQRIQAGQKDAESGIDVVGILRDIRDGEDE